MNRRVEVECAGCRTRYMKRKDSLVSWTGLCRRCSSAAVSRRSEVRAARSEAAKRQCAEGRGILAIDYSKRRVRRGAEVNTWKGGKPKCVDCGTELVGYRGKRCHPCMHASQRGVPKSAAHRQALRAAQKSGPAHPQWKGGKRRKTDSADYREWRTAVFQRDNYTCQECGDRSRRGHPVILHAHHLEPVAHRPDLALAQSNGQTLCAPCHRRTDNYGIKVFRQRAG